MADKNFITIPAISRIDPATIHSELSVKRADNENGDYWQNELEEENLENCVTMKVMKMTGLPKSYRESLYTDVVEAVKEISNLPAETASTFYNLVNWICGGESSSEVPADEVGSNEGKNSNELAESLLASPSSQITVPLSTTSMADSNLTGDRKGGEPCKRLPPLLMKSSSKCSMGEKPSSVGIGSSLFMVSGFESNVSSVASKSNCPPLQCENTVFTCQGDNIQPMISATWTTDDNNNEILELPDEDKTLLEEICDKVVGNTFGKSEDTIEKPELPPTSSPIVLTEPQTSVPAPMPAPPSDADTTPLSSPPPLLPTTKSKQLLRERSTSQLQLAFNDNLKELETLVKKLYKGMGKKGQFSVVATVKPKQDGDLDLDIDTTDLEETDSELTTTAQVSDSADSDPKPETNLEEKKIRKSSAVSLNDKPKEEEKKTVHKPSEGSSFLSKTMFIPRPKPSTPTFRRPSTANVLPSRVQSKILGSALEINRNPRPPVHPSILKHVGSKPPTSGKRVSLNNVTMSAASETSGSSSSGSENTEMKTRLRTSFEATAYNAMTQPRCTQNSRSMSRLNFRVPENKRPQTHNPGRPASVSHSQFGWDLSPFHMSSQSVGNVRVAKSCHYHETVPTFYDYPQNSYQYQRFQQQHLDQGDYVNNNNESDDGTSTTSIDTASVDTECDESAAIAIDKAFQNDPLFGHQFSQGSFLGQITSSTRQNTTLGQITSSTRQSTMRPQTCPAMEPQEHKFRPTVYIPVASPGQQQRRNTSYTGMFKEKQVQQQQQTIYVDMTSHGGVAKSQTHFGPKSRY